MTEGGALVSHIVTQIFGCILCGVGVAFVHVLVARSSGKVISVVWRSSIASALVAPCTNVLHLAPDGFGTKHKKEW